MTDYDFLRHYFQRYIAVLLAILVVEVFGLGIVVFLLSEIRDAVKKLADRG